MSHAIVVLRGRIVYDAPERDYAGLSDLAGDGENPVRTTLDIDDDVLAVARKIAFGQNRDLGEVMSDLARRSLASAASRATLNGVPLLADRRATVTHETVNGFRDGSP